MKRNHIKKIIIILLIILLFVGSKLFRCTFCPTCSTCMGDPALTEIEIQKIKDSTKFDTIQEYIPQTQR